MQTVSEFALSPDVQRLLDDLAAPLAPESPCGAPARHDPVFTDIRFLREEDDPNLPMGHWERPLKCADWAQIERRCLTVLSAQSKDLQIVLWLVESWTRQNGLSGLCQGLRLLDTMLRMHWQHLHPQVEDDGDCDARLAPLEWLNESLSATVRVHVPLLHVGGAKLKAVTLADWERVAAAGEGEESGAAAGTEPGLTRSAIVAAARGPEAGLARLRAAARDGIGTLDRVIDFLGGRLGADAPKLGKLQNVLESMDRVLLHWLPAQPASGVSAPLDAAEKVTSVPVQVADPDAAAAPPSVPARADWCNRDDAYATLDALAVYLLALEPHSPVPFLIRRAVRWSRMPLPEVLAEVVREEGDLNRLVNVLGISL